MPMTSTSNMHPTRSGVEDPFAFGALERFSTTYGPERHILRIPLNGNIFIGRGLHNDLVLEDEHISWSHCKITYTASEPPVVTLTAMRTRNGTFVNGIRLKPEQTHNLNDDDLISLGTPVAPQKLSREDKNSVHIAGIYAERRQLRQIGWQFKFYRLTRAEVTQGAVGRCSCYLSANTRRTPPGRKTGMPCSRHLPDGKASYACVCSPTCPTRMAGSTTV
ncbi:SMAD/FHA domain-containing protein [Peniophora sp. CONT]|nr:SMAD/FHA domain-containing protein [Peniophora sp. CONT]